MLGIPHHKAAVPGISFSISPRQQRIILTPSSDTFWDQQALPQLSAVTDAGGAWWPRRRTATARLLGKGPTLTRLLWQAKMVLLPPTTTALLSERRRAGLALLRLGVLAAEGAASSVCSCTV